MSSLQILTLRQTKFNHGDQRPFLKFTQCQYQSYESNIRRLSPRSQLGGSLQAETSLPGSCTSQGYSDSIGLAPSTSSLSRVDQFNSCIYTALPEHKQKELSAACKTAHRYHSSSSEFLAQESDQGNSTPISLKHSWAQLHPQECKDSKNLEQCLKVRDLTF